MAQTLNANQNTEGCVFPTGPDGQICGRSVAVNGKPSVGRRRMYCDDPEHTRAKAFVARRKYDLAYQDSGQDGVIRAEIAVSEHPVTDGRVSLGALVGRFEESSTRMVAILDRCVEVIHTVSDPDAAGYEVEQVQREAAVQVTQAQTAQATAEHEATASRR